MGVSILYGIVPATLYFAAAFMVRMFQLTPERHAAIRQALAEGGKNEVAGRSEEHTSELHSLMSISYAAFCLQNKRLHKRNRKTETIGETQHDKSIHILRHTQRHTHSNE